ncbi:hypothetical protein [Oxalobacter formigenes]|uniref:hypothetical protein n=1 Tax=Oxalobacter formigenes TaxID=847 RepID=UPI0011DCA1B6|nr:hypothetical protein [Oxalobacter formigenes]MCZ4062967.1 hypothetical protein [Oxalobacter formigenes]WAW00841.1 hypothetical protein NB644_07770 [Oxalobacter formigenes]WAW03171.1 hypothetical protein NB642_08550 [Oxalobacter formigenes]WAW06391.1 hypothetical protein NB639_02995 [Oxalobacter formigenes]WAW07223.1 hypothetical protein NB638_06685 [Oxalobacter formigenes]
MAKSEKPSEPTPDDRKISLKAFLSPSIKKASSQTGTEKPATNLPSARQSDNQTFKPASRSVHPCRLHQTNSTLPAPAKHLIRSSGILNHYQTNLPEKKRLSRVKTRQKNTHSFRTET